MKRILAGLGCMLLIGCATKVATLTPQLEAQMHQDLINGQAVLDCNLGCSGSFGYARSRLRTLYISENWPALGTLVMQIGYQGDLPYYYLGRAAEGQGAYEAAKKYYEIAGFVATSPMAQGKCGGSINVCDGFSFPRDIYPRLRMVQAEIARSQMVAQRPVYNSPAPAVLVSQSQPVARPAPPVVHPTQPKPAGSLTEEADWVRPPPVTR
jgi:hypothetical protein